MIIAAHQPQFFPWLGYFDKIDRVDAFVLLDNVQFKKNEWQNRNKIKTAQGGQWFTVPVCYSFPQLISEVSINNVVRWQHKLRQAIVSNYSRAPYFHYLDELFEEVFSRPWHGIAELNIYTVRALAGILGITTPIHIASELSDLPSGPDERLIALTRLYNADAYLAGAGGRDYMNLDSYAKRDIKVAFQEYRHPEYQQLFGDFLPYLSVIDLLLNHGEASLKILRSQQPREDRI